MILISSLALDPSVSSTKNFARHEFACRGCPGTCAWSTDGLSLARVDPEAADRLQWMREGGEAPMTLNSACRCPDHNRRVGGAANSDHRADFFRMSTGFDPAITAGWTKSKIIEWARKAGFNAFGINYRTFVHIGRRPGRRIRQW